MGAPRPPAGWGPARAFGAQARQETAQRGVFSPLRLCGRGEPTPLPLFLAFRLRVHQNALTTGTVPVSSRRFAACPEERACF